MIYLDNNATTATDERVLKKALPFLTDLYANAASAHQDGKIVLQAVNKARTQVANLIQAQANEITFTSGATEAINWAIKGVAQTYQDKGNHIITLQTEHAAVLQTCQYLEKIGYEVSYLAVENDGLLNMQHLKDAIREETILIVVMLANNEIGVLQDLAQIVEIAHENNILVFSDATQAVGKIPIDVKKINIDMIAFSGHKFYAPKGIGVLYKNEQKRIRIEPLLHGGGQEKGFRAGTLNTFGIVAIGEACEIARLEILENEKRIKAYRDYFENKVLELPDTFLNGNIESRLFNTSNICFYDIESSEMILAFDEIAVSNGSACTSMKIEPSHVLKAIGLTDAQAFASIRFSFGKNNSFDEIKIAAEKTKIIVERLRASSQVS